MEAFGAFICYEPYQRTHRDELDVAKSDPVLVLGVHDYFSAENRIYFS